MHERHDNGSSRAQPCSYGSRSNPRRDDSRSLKRRIPPDWILQPFNVHPVDKQRKTGKIHGRHDNDNSQSNPPRDGSRSNSPRDHSRSKPPRDGSRSNPPRDRSRSNPPRDGSRSKPPRDGRDMNDNSVNSRRSKEPNKVVKAQKVCPEVSCSNVTLARIGRYDKGSASQRNSMPRSHRSPTGPHQKRGDLDNIKNRAVDMSYNQPGSQSSLKGSYRKRTWMFSKRQHNSDNVDNITSEVQNHVTDTNEEADVPIEPTVDDSDAESDHCGSGSRAKVTTETVADDRGDDSSSTSRSSSSSRSSRSSSSSSSSSRSSSSSSSSSVSIHNHNDDKDDCHSSATKHVIQKVSSRIKHSVPIKLKRTKVSGLKRDPVSDPYVYNDPEHQYTEDDVCSGAVYTLSNPPKTDDTEPESAPSEATSAANQPKQPDSAAETQPKQPDTAAETQPKQPDTAAETQTRELDTTADIQTPEPDAVAEIQTPETESAAEIQTWEPESAAEIQTPEPESAAEIQTPEPESAAEIQTPETESAAEIKTPETESAAEIQTPETAYTIPNPRSAAEPGSQRLGEPCEMSCNVPECRVDNGILLAAPGYQDRAEDAVSATEDLTRSGCANSKGTESALDSIAKGYRCDISHDEADAALDIITSCVTATENERASDDMLTDVQYVNAFPECDISHFYDSEPHFSRPQWNVDPCPGLIFSATTDPGPSSIPLSSSAICHVVTQPKDVSLNDDCIGDMPSTGYPDNSMFDLERACSDYIFQQQSALQLDPHLVEVHQDPDPQVSTPQQEDAVVLDPEQPISQVPYTPQPTVDIHGFNVYKLKPVTALQSQRSLFPTPPQSEAAGTYEELAPDPSLQHLDSDGDPVLSIAMISPLMQKLIICSACTTTFNRAVICNTYLIQLNRPIQCACGCVLCTLCYSQQRGCSLHNMSSTRAPVSTTASTLANCPALEHLGAWDLELNIGDMFKTDNEVNVHVQLLMNKEQSPDMDTLRPVFNHLVTEKDTMSFKYWVNEAMPEEVACRYVCIPHIPGFWDHVVVGTRTLPKTANMIGPDDSLPRLFNVSLGSYKFHWCCFVLKKQIILTMWCTSMPSRGQPKVFTLVDSTLKNHTSSIEFRRMVFYLCRWFTAQYGSPPDRQLNMVLDCKPSEGPTLVHVIAFLASRLGMEKVTPQFSQHRAKDRAKDDRNYSFKVKHANTMFTCPSDGTSEGNYIDIVEEFSAYHNSGCNDIGLTRVCTTTEVYSFL
ncbi:uncharacterized protein ACWYII_031232 [Salvelinus alpinus]